MKYTVERYFGNVNGTCLGAGYEFFTHILEDLIYKMKDKIGREFREEECLNLTFLMNIPFYHKFCTVCQATCHDSDMYMGIRIIIGPSLSIGESSARPDGIVQLAYEESGTKRHSQYYDFCTNLIKNASEFSKYCIHDVETIYGLYTYQLKSKPHIDHVKFNGPATIVFWKDGTKTVVKHDGKGRKDKKQAILYAFIRKIYGEGKPYHNILNEIEEAVK